MSLLLPIGDAGLDQPDREEVKVAGLTAEELDEITRECGDVHVSNMVFVAQIGPTKISRARLQISVPVSREGTFPARACMRQTYVTFLVFKDKAVIIGVTDEARAIMFIHSFVRLLCQTHWVHNPAARFDVTNLVLTNMHATVDFHCPISLDAADAQVVGAVYDKRKINMLYAKVNIERGGSSLQQLHGLNNKRSQDTKDITINLSASSRVVLMGMEDVRQVRRAVRATMGAFGAVFIDAKRRQRATGQLKDQAVPRQPRPVPTLDLSLDPAAGAPAGLGESWAPLAPVGDWF